MPNERSFSEGNSLTPKTGKARERPPHSIRSNAPKLDHYASHDFLTAYSTHLDSASGTLTTSEVAAFVTSSAVITGRKDDRFDIDGVIERWDSSPDLLKYATGARLHGLFDYLVDGHFATVQDLDE